MGIIQKVNYNDTKYTDNQNYFVLRTCIFG